MQRMKSAASRLALAVAIAAGSGVATGCGNSDSPTAEPPDDGPPAVALSASAANGFVGQLVVLTWSSTHTTSCTASGAWSGSLPTSGSQTVTAATEGAQTYSLSCAGRAGSASASATFTARASAMSVTNQFTPNKVTISTSEGAPYGNGSLWPPRTELYSRLGYGPTKVQRLYICLSGKVDQNDCSKAPRVSGPLSSEMLAGIDSGIAAYQGTGARLLIRFIYKWDESGGEIPDPPLSLMLTHNDQLAPILLKHRDLIMALESGFIGNWGQWVNKTSNLDTSAVAHKQLLDKQLAHYKGAFPVLLPWVNDLSNYAGGRFLVDGLGLHDDDFNSGPGTAQPFFNRDARSSLSGIEAYASQVAAASLFVGEMTNTYPAQSCARQDSVAHQFHLQSISLEDWPNGIWDLLQNAGCGLSFLNKVGARIELQSATIVGDPTPGGSLFVGLTMLNAGYGRVIRARPVSLIFLSNSNVVGEVSIPLEALDLRQLVSRAGPKTFPLNITVPSTIPSGSSVSIAVRVRDPAPSLSGQAAYALPLNSVDSSGREIFDSVTGLNTIARFTVTQPPAPHRR